MLRLTAHLFFQGLHNGFVRDVFVSGRVIMDYMIGIMDYMILFIMDYMMYVDIFIMGQE